MATDHQNHRTLRSRSVSSTVYISDAMAQTRMSNTAFATTSAKGEADLLVPGGLVACKAHVVGTELLRVIQQCITILLRGRKNDLPVGAELLRSIP